jgi:hypothetical protein
VADLVNLGEVPQMQIRKNIGKYAATLGCFCFSLWAIDIFLKEYKDFYTSAGMQPQYVLQGEDAFAQPPFGVQSVSRALDRCFAGLDQLQAGVLNTQAKARGYQRCLRFADLVLHRSPSLGAAHQLRAESLHLLGDSQGAVFALGESARAAPNTAWLAQRRVILAVHLPDAPAQMIDADIARLMSNSQTRAWLAQIYAATAEMRPLITRNEAKFRAQDAQNFMQMLRREMMRLQREGR